MELETTFYIIAIIFMTVMLVFVGILVAAVIVIKTRINALHDSIDHKINQVKSVTRKTAVGAKALKYFFGRLR